MSVQAALMGITAILTMLEEHLDKVDPGDEETR